MADPVDRFAESSFRNRDRKIPKKAENERKFVISKIDPSSEPWKRSSDARLDATIRISCRCELPNIGLATLD